MHSYTALPLSVLAVASYALPQGTTTSSALPTATAIHTFPVGTQIENLALRDNTAVLANLINVPEIAYVDLANPDAAAPIIASFPAPAEGVLGIDKLDTDVFYVATSSKAPNGLGPRTNGTGQIWEVDLREYDGCPGQEDKMKTKLVATVAGSGLLNGVGALKGTRGLLVADSTMGLIWRVDVDSGEATIAIQNELTSVDTTATLPLGANGVHVRDGYAYWTNTARQALARAPINENGIATGPAQAIVQGTPNPGPDDFDFGTQSESAFITDAALNAVQFAQGGGAIAPVVGLSSRPTAVKVAEDGEGRVLYISTAGTETEGGAISTFRLA